MFHCLSNQNYYFMFNQQVKYCLKERFHSYYQEWVEVLEQEKDILMRNDRSCCSSIEMNLYMKHYYKDWLYHYFSIILKFNYFECCSLCYFPNLWYQFNLQTMRLSQKQYQFDFYLMCCLFNSKLCFKVKCYSCTHFYCRKDSDMNCFMNSSNHYRGQKSLQKNN